MRTLARSARLLLGLVCSATLLAETQPAGFVDFGPLAAPTGGGQFVDVQIKNNLISMVARLAEREEPEVAALLRGIQFVRVNVVGLNEENRAPIQEKIAAINRQLTEQGWDRIVTVQESAENVGVFLKARGEEAVEGIVITVIDSGKEAVLVNVVGDVRPEKLATVGERFNLTPLKRAGEALKQSAPAEPAK